MTIVTETIHFAGMIAGQWPPVAVADRFQRADIQRGWQKAERMVALQAVHVLEKNETATRITMKGLHTQSSESRRFSPQFPRNLIADKPGLDMRPAEPPEFNWVTHTPLRVLRN